MMLRKPLYFTLVSSGRSSVRYFFMNSSLNRTRNSLVNVRKSIKVNISFSNLSKEVESSPMEKEKLMFKINREISSNYAMGKYDEALESAMKLEVYVEQTMGKNNTIYASCLNNIALMNKMLGNYEIAIEKYIDSLHCYEDVIGKSHISYIRTLANLGIVCKTYADMCTGMHREQLMLRAEEALSDAAKAHSKLSGYK